MGYGTAMVTVLHLDLDSTLCFMQTDEASPHYWATIDNLIEGHQFLKTELSSSSSFVRLD